MDGLRPYEDADLAGCVDLWQGCGLTVWYNDPAADIALWTRSDCAEIFVAPEDGRIVGTICCGHDGHRGWLYYVAVDPQRRGTGLGRQLVHKAEDWLGQQGIRKIQLMVRETNRPVLDFYAALGYAHTPRAVMARWLELPSDPPDGAKLPLDLAVAAGRDLKVNFVITFLQMTERPRLTPVHPPRHLQVALMRAHRPTVDFYRFLYHGVGAEWNWWYRRQMADDDLAAILEDERVEVFVLYVEGVPAGYFELDRREAPDVDLAYFGLLPQFVGQQLGPYLLNQAIEQAWSYEPGRLTVNTNTMDHPKALPLYQKFGFQPYRQERLVMPDPRLNGTIPG
ncbi:GNAT family acetyltransferase [Pelagibius sp.]|uniref:GNAT family acetyltransferase n=1 Tax=Pelagibius sp. TaxID=1931238 RepID=UPI003B514969